MSDNRTTKTYNKNEIISLVPDRGAHPASIAVDPSGRYAYILNVLARTVSQYTIGSNGVLMAMTPVSVSTGSNPYAITVDPSGRYAYVLSVYARAVSQYTIGPNGVLTEMSPVAVSAGGRPH